MSALILIDPKFIVVANKIGIEIEPIIPVGSDLHPSTSLTLNSDESLLPLNYDNSLDVGFVDNDDGFNFLTQLDKPKGFADPEPSISSPSTPDGLKGIPAIYRDQSVIWTKISKHQRGKHPKKQLFL